MSDDEDTTFDVSEDVFELPEVEPAKKFEFVKEEEEEKEKKGFGLLISLLLGIIVPIVFIVVLSFAGAGSNATILQIDMILAAFLLCLPGILTRSKLKGLIFNPIIGSLDYLILEFGVRAVLTDLENPYGLFNVLGGPNGALTVAVENMDINEPLIDQALSYLLVVDLAILNFILIFGGFFVSGVATGFKRRDGQLSIVSVIFKPIAVIMVIFLLLVFPLALHGLGKTVQGVAYLAAGASELVDLSGGVGGGAGVTQIGAFDLENLDFADLEARSDRAQVWFNKAADAFGHLKGNMLLGAVLSQVAPQLADAPKMLDIIGAIADLTGVFPELLMGFYSLSEGMNKTFSVMGGSGMDFGGGGSQEPSGHGIMESQAMTASVSYDVTFKEGLVLIDFGIANFTAALPGIRDAVAKAKTATDIGLLEEYDMDFSQIFDAIDITLPIFLNASTAISPFLNGTYKSLLGITALGDNDFTTTNNWLSKAVTDFITSNSTLAAVPDAQPVVFTSGYQNVSIPLKETIDIINDMNDLLIPFVLAAVNGTDTIVYLNDTFTDLSKINMSENPIDNPTLWNSADAKMQSATLSLAAAQANIELAGTKATEKLANDYGDMLNPSFKPFMSQMSNFIDTYATNITDIVEMFSAVSNTYAGLKNFAFGTGEFQVEIAKGVSADIGPTSDVVKYYTWSRDNASAAWVHLQNTSVINPSTKTTWENILGNPSGTPPLTSIYGASSQALTTVAQIYVQLDSIPPALLDEMETLADNMNDLSLDEIFALAGGGG